MEGNLEETEKIPGKEKKKPQNFHIEVKRDTVFSDAF